MTATVARALYDQLPIRALQVGRLNSAVIKDVSVPPEATSVQVDGVPPNADFTLGGLGVAAVSVDGPKIERRVMGSELAALFEQYRSLLDAFGSAQTQLATMRRKVDLAGAHLEAQLAAHPPEGFSKPCTPDGDQQSALLGTFENISAAATPEIAEKTAELRDLKRKLAVARAALEAALPSDANLPFIPDPRSLDVASLSKFMLQESQTLQIQLTQPPADDSSEAEIGGESAAQTLQLHTVSPSSGLTWHYSLNLDLVESPGRPSGYEALLSCSVEVHRPVGRTWADVDLSLVYDAGGEKRVPEVVRKKIELVPVGQSGGNRGGHQYGRSCFNPSLYAAAASGASPIKLGTVTLDGASDRHFFTLLSKQEAPVEVFRYAVPDETPAAFMMISLTNNTAFTFHRGDEIRVTMNGVRIGSTTLDVDAVAPADLLSLSVGPDPAISVVQEKVPEVRAKEGFIVKSNKREIAQDVRLTGHALENDTPLAVLFSCPVSTDSKIKVTQVSPSNATKLEYLDFSRCVIEALRRFNGSRSTFLEENSGRYIDVVMVPRRSSVTLSRKCVIEFPNDTEITIS